MIHYQHRKKQKHVTFFLGLATEQQETTLDVYALHWLPYEIARDKLEFPEAQELLDQAEKFLRAKK